MRLSKEKKMLVPEDALSAFFLPWPLASEFCIVTGTEQTLRRQCSSYNPLGVIYPKFPTSQILVDSPQCSDHCTCEYLERTAMRIMKISFLT